MQNAVPNWLPNNCHYIDNLYNQYDPHRLKELKKIIKEKFICYGSKPKWLQSPDWIIEQEPLIFIGQMDVTKMYHDTTFLYIFLNKQTSSYQFITQSA